MAVTPVRMRDLPNEVTVSRHQHHEAESWCRANLGPRWSVLDNRSGVWCCFWAGFRNDGGYRYYFESAQTAVEFALRWS